jgi:hypothetical protein
MKVRLEAVQWPRNMPRSVRAVSGIYPLQHRQMSAQRFSQQPGSIRQLPLKSAKQFTWLTRSDLVGVQLPDRTAPVEKSTQFPTQRLRSSRNPSREVQPTGHNPVQAATTTAICPKPCPHLFRALPSVVSSPRIGPGQHTSENPPCPRIVRSRHQSASMNNSRPQQVRARAYGHGLTLESLRPRNVRRRAQSAVADKARSVRALNAPRRPAFGA